MKVKGVLLLFISSTLLSFTPCYENVQGEWAYRTLQTLTLREKIGQLFIVATISSTEQSEEALASSLLQCPYRMDPDYIKYLIEEYKIGGLIFLYKSKPIQQIEATNNYQRLSTIPLLIGQDCEWGLSMRLDDTMVFPRNKALGALKDKQLIYALGLEIGKQCKAIGVHINFSPVVDINTNPHNPVIGSRSFGDTPQLVSECGLLMMQGLQDAGILSCAKHFPGHGDTSIDSHFALPLINHSYDRLVNVEFEPFRHLIDGGVAAIMSAHLQVPAIEPERPSSLSRCVVTNVLADQMNFKGLKITDGLGMQAITNQYAPGEMELEAFLAGNDILLCPLDVPKAVELIEYVVKNDKVLSDDLEKRVLKILKAKEWAGCQTHNIINKNLLSETLFDAKACELQKKLFEEVENR